MKKALLVLALLPATATAFAAENQAFWGVFAETHVQKMAGMPALPPLPPGVDADAMAQIPGMAAVLGMGTPKRSLSVRLWSPGIPKAPRPASPRPPAQAGRPPRPDPTARSRAKWSSMRSSTLRRPNSPSNAIGSAAKVKPGQPR